MINPVASSNAIHQTEVSQAASKQVAAGNAAAKNQPARPQDSVTLKSRRDADHDGDSK
jgi:hypothetical protein